MARQNKSGNKNKDKGHSKAVSVGKVSDQGHSKTASVEKVSDKGHSKPATVEKVSDKPSGKPWPYAAGYDNCPEVLQPTSLKVKGTIPPWLEGTLYRSGPG